MGSRSRPGHLVVRRIAESEMFYKNNIEYFIFEYYFDPDIF